MLMIDPKFYLSENTLLSVRRFVRETIHLLDEKDISILLTYCCTHKANMSVVAYVIAK